MGALLAAPPAAAPALAPLRLLPAQPCTCCAGVGDHHGWRCNRCDGNGVEPMRTIVQHGQVHGLDYGLARAADGTYVAVFQWPGCQHPMDWPTDKRSLERAQERAQAMLGRVLVHRGRDGLRCWVCRQEHYRLKQGLLPSHSHIQVDPAAPCLTTWDGTWPKGVEPWEGVTVPASPVFLAQKLV